MWCKHGIMPIWLTISVGAPHLATSDACLVDNHQTLGEWYNLSGCNHHFLVSYCTTQSLSPSFLFFYSNMKITCKVLLLNDSLNICNKATHKMNGTKNICLHLIS